MIVTAHIYIEKKIDRYLKKHKLDLNTSRLGLSVKVRRHVWQRKESIFQFCREEKKYFKNVAHIKCRAKVKNSKSS